MSNATTIPSVPSATDLIDAFLSDLQNLFKLFQGGSQGKGSLPGIAPAAERQTRALFYNAGASATTFTFKCDRDYWYRGAITSGGYVVTVTTDGSGTGIVNSATKTAKEAGVLHAQTSGSLGPATQQRTFLPKDTSITVGIGTAGGVATILLEW